MLKQKTVLDKNEYTKNNIKYILTGGNFSTECIREPLEWAYHASDLKHIKEIHKIFGKEKFMIIIGLYLEV